MPNDNEINLSLFPDKLRERKDSIDFSLFPDKPIKENVNIPPALPSFSGFDSKKMSTAIIDANTLSFLTGEDVNPSTTYDMQDVINESIEDDSWGNIFKKSVATMVISPLTAVGGLVRAVEERQGFESEIGKETADYWSKILKEQEIDAAPYSFRKYAGMIIQNTLQNTPTLAVAAATGSQAIPLTVMGLQAAGLKYQQLREMGQSPEIARTSAAIVGASEALTETLPLDVLIRPGIPFAKRLLLSASLDVPGEMINTAIESALDKVTITPEMTWKDFGVALAETAIVSLGTAGLLTSISHPIVYAREQHEKKLKTIEDKKIEELNNFTKQTDEELNKAVEEIKTQTEQAATETPPEATITEAEIKVRGEEQLTQLLESDREVTDDDLGKIMAGEDIGEPVTEVIKPNFENLIEREQDEVKQHVDISIMAANKGKMDIAEAEAEKARANGEALKLADGEEIDKRVEADLSRLPEPQAGEGKVEIEQLAEQYGGINPNSIKQYKEAIEVARGGNPVSLMKLLHKGNKNLRKLFTDETGIKLPNTEGGTKATIRQWAENVKPEVKAEQGKVDTKLQAKIDKATNEVKRAEAMQDLYQIASECLKGG